MPYIRKTSDEWQIHQYTGPQFGWEEVSAYDNRKEAVADLKAYRKNQLHCTFKLVKKRVEKVTARYAI